MTKEATEALNSTIWFFLSLMGIFSLMGLFALYIKEKTYSSQSHKKSDVIIEAKKEAAIRILKIERAQQKMLTWVEIDAMEKEAIEKAFQRLRKNREK